MQPFLPTPQAPKDPAWEAVKREIDKTDAEIYERSLKFVTVYDNIHIGEYVGPNGRTYLQVFSLSKQKKISDALLEKETFMLIRHYAHISDERVRAFYEDALRLRAEKKKRQAARAAS